MNKERLNKIVVEEVEALLKTAEKDHKRVAKKLDELRKKLHKDEQMPLESIGAATPKVKEKRLDLKLVSEIVDIPVNELMLYFLNCIKNNNERSLVEYRLGSIYFYNC